MNNFPPYFFRYVICRGDDTLFGGEDFDYTDMTNEIGMYFNQELSNENYNLPLNICQKYDELSKNFEVVDSYFGALESEPKVYYIIHDKENEKYYQVEGYHDSWEGVAYSALNEYVEVEPYKKEIRKWRKK